MCAGRERSTDREINKTSRIKQVTPSMLGSMQILNIQINMAATERKKQDNPILLPLNQSMLSDVVLPKQLVCFEWKFLIRYATGEITVYFLICFLETLMFQPLRQICGYITHLHDSHHNVVRSTKLVYAFWTRRQVNGTITLSRIRFADGWQKCITWWIKKKYRLFTLIQWNNVEFFNVNLLQS